MEQQINVNLDQALDDLKEAQALNHQQAEQISELINRYSVLEKMHTETLQKLDQWSNGAALPKELQTSVEETAMASQQVKQRVTDFVNRLIKTSKLKSQTALRISMKTMRVDSMLLSIATVLKRFSELLGQLELKIQSLGIEQKMPKIEAEKVEQAPKPEAASRSRVRVGERRPDPILIKKDKVESKLEPEKSPSLAAEENYSLYDQLPPEIPLESGPVPEAAQFDVDPIAPAKETDSTPDLPKELKPILENMVIPIDAAHENTDSLGHSTYDYQVNNKVDVSGIPLESIKGLDSANINDLLKKDVIDRLMDGRLSVDKVFSEEQQTQIIAAYVKQKQQPNAFEQRVSKAAVDKKEQKVSPSQELTQEKQRSR